MALTDHCDVFGSIHEDGINTVIRHVMRQRPSLFNYGSDAFVNAPERLCERVDVHPDVPARNNPVLTREDPIAIPGTAGQLGLEFCAQLVDLRIDFHPGNAIVLPQELNPPLSDQSLAVTGRLCVGLGCPSARILVQYDGPSSWPQPRPATPKDDDTTSPKPPARPLPFERPLCFCVDLVGVAKLSRAGNSLGVQLQGLELVDISPPGLEGVLECFLATTLRASVFPKLRIAVSTLVFELGDWITLTPSAPSANIPHNPSIANDMVSVFLDQA